MSRFGLVVVILALISCIPQAKGEILFGNTLYLNENKTVLFNSYYDEASKQSAVVGWLSGLKAGSAYRVMVIVESELKDRVSVVVGETFFVQFDGWGLVFLKVEGFKPGRILETRIETWNLRQTEQLFR